MQHKNMYTSGKIMKIEKSQIAIFDEIWPRPCTIVQGVWPDF